jgi:flavodoxin
MRSCVIYGSRYGNTEKIARSLEAGLRAAGVETICVNQTDVKVDALNQYDLLCVGAPTEMFTAYKPTKEFLAALSVDLPGKYGFAFDTKIGSHFSGSASKLIEKELTGHGLKIIAPRESAIVFTEKGVSGAHLKEGEEARFEQIGRELGAKISRLQGGSHS